jgi:hypothetical protein
MNERIKELEQQCWEVRQYNPPWFNATKFAELIVEECMSNLYLHGYDDARAQIKQHFGVEE